jgi:hypothetical protein
MDNNRRDPITGAWDDPLGNFAHEESAHPSGAGDGPGDPIGDSDDGARGDQPRACADEAAQDSFGYGRQPKKHQFKKGQRSPNPSGRPKGIKNEATILNDLLEEKIQIRVGRRVRTVSMLTAMLMRFRDAALKGDIKSAGFILNRQNQHSSNEPAQPETNQDDQEVIETYLRKALRARKGESE